MAQFTDEEIAELAQESDEERPHGPWSREATLLALLIDHIGVLINVQLGRAGVKTSGIQPVRRPGVVPQKSRKANPQEIAFLQRIRDKQRADKAAAEGGVSRG